MEHHITHTFRFAQCLINELKAFVCHILGKSSMKKVAIDCYYYETDCKAVGIVFDSFEDKTPIDIITKHVKCNEAYVPGQFYKRELPGIMAILEEVDLSTIDTIVIDGNVMLRDTNGVKKPGLGMKLYEKIHKDWPKIKVIGVAKKRFGTTDSIAGIVIRGNSKNPLYVTTSPNADLLRATSQIQGMHGKYRIPTLLKILDKETKTEDKLEDVKSKKPETKKRSWRHKQNR